MPDDPFDDDWIEPWTGHQHPDRPFDIGLWLCDCWPDDWVREVFVPVHGRLRQRERWWSLTLAEEGPRAGRGVPIRGRVVHRRERSTLAMPATPIVLRP